MTTDKDLVDFGNYMLSGERENTLFPHEVVVDEGEPFCNNDKIVYHSDLENFKALQEKEK